MASSPEAKTPPVGGDGGGGGHTMVREMAKIRESTARLGVLVRAALADNSTVGAVFEELEGSISRAFSLLACKESPVEAGQSPDASREQGSEVSNKKRKINPVGDRRGGSRRRAQSSSLKIVKSKTLDDGQAWRKYGQKDIQSSKHPRSYFRCTHKYDQDCKAIRQAQRSEEDPSTYTITYIGEHTCRDPAMVPQIISASSFKDTCLISFGTSSYSIRQEAALPASFACQKQEIDEEVVSNLTTESSSSSLDNLVLPAAENTAAMTPAGGQMTDHGDVTSGFQHSPADLNLDFMAETYFDDMLSFDDEGFF